MTAVHRHVRTDRLRLDAAWHRDGLGYRAVRIRDIGRGRSAAAEDLLQQRQPDRAGWHMVIHGRELLWNHPNARVTGLQ